MTGQGLGVERDHSKSRASAVIEVQYPLADHDGDPNSSSPGTGRNASRSGVRPLPEDTPDRAPCEPVGNV